MSIRLEMLQVARLAPKLLDEARDPIVDFFREQWAADGGGKDRAGNSDLYYTVFALEGLISLQVDPPHEEIERYLTSFGDGRDLDLVHLGCLARCWAALPQSPPATIRRGMIDRLDTHRSEDGGFAAESSAARGSAYHGFVAYSAYQDLGAPLPAPERLSECIRTLTCGDGSFTNDLDNAFGNTPATAAAVTLGRALGLEPPPETGPWLLARCHPETGGFLAWEGAPIPDLLSTATALHALSCLKVPLDPIRDRCLDFLDTLWTGRSFCGSWSDDIADSEYTWYALLALGHLSL